MPILQLGLDLLLSQALDTYLLRSLCERRFLGWRGSRSRWEGESLLHSCPLLSPWGALPLSLFACGILASPPGENLQALSTQHQHPGPCNMVSVFLLPALPE